MSSRRWWWQGGEGRETEAQGQNYRGARQDPGRGLANGKRLPGIRRKGNSYAIESLEIRQLLTAISLAPDAFVLSQSLPSAGQVPAVSAHTTPASSEFYVALLPLVAKAAPTAASPTSSEKSPLPFAGSATLDAVPPANAFPMGTSRGDVGSRSAVLSFVAMPPSERHQASEGAVQPPTDHAPTENVPKADAARVEEDNTPTPMTIEEAIERIERTIKKLNDEASDGKDTTLEEALGRWRPKVVADTTGFRAPALRLMPEVYRQAVEDLETSWILRFTSGLEWGRYYAVPGPGWDGGVGDAWMRMEVWRLELLRSRIGVIEGAIP